MISIEYLIDVLNTHIIKFVCYVLLGDVISWHQSMVMESEHGTHFMIIFDWM